MGKFIYLANIIAADVDFYNIEGNRGDSYLPFIGFMMFVVGAVVAFMGFSKYITAKKNFNLFLIKPLMRRTRKLESLW